MESIIIESIKNMSLLDCVILLILIIGVDWLKSYFTKKGSNNADKEDTRITSYEGKKGGNAADYEDQIHIQQKERLVNILYLAEKIQQSISKYVLYFYDITTRTKFDQLVEELNSLLTDLYHEQRLANLYISEEQQEILDNLLTSATGIVAEMCTNSTNAASCITNHNYCIQLAKENLGSKASSDVLEKALEYKTKFDKIGAKDLLLKDNFKDCILKYADWLGNYLKQNLKTKV